MAPVVIKLVFWNRLGVSIAVADEVVDEIVIEVAEEVVENVAEEVTESKARRFAFTQVTGWQTSAASTAQPESTRRKMIDDSIVKYGPRPENDIIAVFEQSMNWRMTAKEAEVELDDVKQLDVGGGV
jgi:hypothetical protein